MRYEDSINLASVWELEQDTVAATTITIRLNLYNTLHNVHSKSNTSLLLSMASDVPLQKSLKYTSTTELYKKVLVPHLHPCE